MSYRAIRKGRLMFALSYLILLESQSRRMWWYFGLIDQDMVLAGYFPAALRR